MDKIRPEIKKVLEREDGTKYVIIPRGSLIQKDDLVQIIKVNGVLG
jgi:hypothetical protein